MSTSLPPSRNSSLAPAGVPPSGNGKYVAVVVVLLGALGGLFAYKSCGQNGEPQAGPRPASTFDAAPLSHAVEEPVPPPPPVEEPPPDAGSKVATHIGTASDPCAVKSCSGTSTDELESALAFAASKAKKPCYERFLQQDTSLQGKVGVAVRIASNGQVCKADLSSSDSNMAQVGQCAVSLFRAKSFPPPKSGCVDIVVPISFVPGGK